MANNSSEEKDKNSDMPEPEVLRVKSDTESSPVQKDGSKQSRDSKDVKKVGFRKRTAYRPSHKATFIGIAVVVGILAVNAVIIYFVMSSQSQSNPSVNKNQVTISSAALDKLGVSRNPVGNIGTELVVGPNSRFSGTVTIDKSVSIAGQLNLNSKFSATDASLAKLEAGNTSISQLNVNGDGTISTLSLRKDLSVIGSSKLQGTVVIGQLLTVNNSVNVAGNLAVGGTLSIGSFQTNILTIGGHVITRGNAPGVSRGSASGSNGTVSISGNDAAGTVAVNVGTGGGNGVLANISFVSRYGSTPHVVITAVGMGIDKLYVNRTSSGFSICAGSAVSPGGYAFDYFVTQ